MPSQMGVEMIEPGADNVPIVSALPDDMVVLANGWGVMLGGGQMFIGLCAVEPADGRVRGLVTR